MADITIYTMPGCPYCKRAKDLLTTKKQSFKEITVATDADWAHLEKLTGRESVPQIFINGKHIGGSDDLMVLERSKKLDALLGTKS